MQHLQEKYPQPLKVQTEVLGPMVCSTVPLVRIGVETSTSDRLSYRTWAHTNKGTRDALYKHLYTHTFIYTHCIHPLLQKQCSGDSSEPPRRDTS